MVSISLDNLRNSGILIMRRETLTNDTTIGDSDNFGVSFFMGGGVGGRVGISKMIV